MVTLNAQQALKKGFEDSGGEFVSGYVGYIASNFIKEFPWFEWAVNERSAVAMAHMHSYLGKRSLVIVKDAWLNDAALPFVNSCALGANAGMVVVVTEDEELRMSENRQDCQYYAHLSKTLILDPKSPSELYYLTLEGFRMSEKHRLPILLRVTNKLNNPLVSEDIEIGGLEGKVGRARRDPSKWVLHPKTSAMISADHDQRYTKICLEVGGSESLDEILGNESVDADTGERKMNYFSESSKYEGVFDLIRQRTPGIVIGDFGSYTLARGSPVEYGLHYGGSLTSAVGADIAGVENIYAVVGDGGFLHGISGLTEAVRKSSRVNYIVLDNGGISGKVPIGVDVRSLAEGVGVRFSRRVEAVDLTEKYFEEMEKTKGPLVLVVDYNK